MKIPGISLRLMFLALATTSAAQGVPALPPAPSSVNETAPLIEPLAGTLFFGPEQRYRMDRARKNGETSSEGNSVEPASSVLNGFVKRSDGQSAIWIDGQLRFNVQGDEIRRLQPHDVGGANSHLKVVLNGSGVPALGSPGDKPKVMRQKRSNSKIGKR